MKILVYGKTVREARRHYTPQAGESVGARTYKEHGNGEECDKRIVIDKKQIKKKKAKK